MCDSITYIKLYCKNYLNLTYALLNSPTRSRELLTGIAYAIINFKELFLKKINLSNYCIPALFTSTVMFSPIITFQCKESPNSNSNNFNTSCGTTDLIELGPPLLNLVVYSKIGIPPFILFMYYILYLLRYINLPFKIINKGYYSNLYIVEEI